MTDDRITDETTAETQGEPRGERAVGDGPFVDHVFRALADWRRRELLSYFRETGAETATLDELALYLSAYEPDSSGGSTHPVEKLTTELQHKHVPQLAATGIVDFDDRTGTVRYQGQPTVEKWLEHVRAVDAQVAEDTV